MEDELTEQERACLQMLSEELKAALDSDDLARIQGTVRAAYDFIDTCIKPRVER